MAELTPEMKQWLKACGWEHHGKPKTNADRIRAMSNEELAGTMRTGCPPGVEMTTTKCTADGRCYTCWLEWLQSPADGGDGDG